MHLEREQEDAELLEMAKKSLADDGLMTEPQKEQMLGVLRAVPASYPQPQEPGSNLDVRKVHHRHR